MKKIYSLVLVAFAGFQFAFAGGGCVIDTANTAFFSPRPDSLPCVERTIAYDEVIQIAIPDSIDLQDFGSPLPFILYVDSVVITGANGLPTGISYFANPSNGVLYGGERGCASVIGTTTDPAGRYPITFIGTFTAHGQPFPPFFDGDTTIDFATLAAQSQGMFELFLDVIEPGAECRPASGINNSDNELNAALSVYPNPSNGVFSVKLNTAERVTGEIAVMDVTGRIVYKQTLDVAGFYSGTVDLSAFSKGLYTLQLKTATGFASKNISIE